jgi:hypothetical protein
MTEEQMIVAPFLDPTWASLEGDPAFMKSQRRKDIVAKATALLAALGRMTEEQLAAAATIQAIAEEFEQTQKRWGATDLRRQGRRLLDALEALVPKEPDITP